MNASTEEDRARAEAVSEAAWRFLLNRYRLARSTPSSDPAELHRIAHRLATGDTHRPIEATHPERRA